MAVEQTVVALATVACTSWAVRLIRAGARRADADAGALSRRMAAQDAALAAEEIKSRAATTVHDDVLSVLRAISVAGQPLPWSLVVAKAKGAQDALARQGSGGTKGPADLGSALHHAGKSAAELDVRYDIDGDIDVPRSAVETLSAAAGEALRNVAAHAGVSSALVTARGSQSGGVTVAVSDDGMGFDPARVGPASTGLRSSVQKRLADVGGRAEIISAPGQGTSVVLTWSPPVSQRLSAGSARLGAPVDPESAADLRRLHAAAPPQRPGIAVPALAGHALARRGRGGVRRHPGPGRPVSPAPEPGADDAPGRRRPGCGEYDPGCGLAGGGSRYHRCVRILDRRVTAGIVIAAVYFHPRARHSGLTALAVAWRR